MSPCSDKQQVLTSKLSTLYNINRQSQSIFIELLKIRICDDSKTVERAPAILHTPTRFCEKISINIQIKYLS